MKYSNFLFSHWSFRTVIFLALAGCATRQDVARDYGETFPTAKAAHAEERLEVADKSRAAEKSQAADKSQAVDKSRAKDEVPRENDSSADRQSNSRRTVVLIVVDGLSNDLVRSDLIHHRIPQLTRFFNLQPQALKTAHTLFPSLTYPSISSLLSGQPVEKTGIYGNLIFESGHVTNFESPFQYSNLNDRLKNKLIFSRLGRKGYKSVSIDYAFHDGATVSTPTLDLEAGLTITDADYQYIDRKSIEAAELTLTSTPPALWPDFLYIHLIGVDLTSHYSGPQSAETHLYFEKLDGELRQLFEILTRAEKSQRRQIVTLLTADHGFDRPVKHYLDLETRVQKASDDITILNEGRFAALFLPKGWANPQREQFARSWAMRKEIDFVSLAEENSFQVLSVQQTARANLQKDEGCGGYKISAGWDRGSEHTDLPWSCLTTLGPVPGFYYPHLLENLGHYFINDSHPDLIIMPKPGYSFLKTMRGQHGGPTEGEIMVPLMTRGAELNTPDPALRDLLKFLDE